MNLLRPRPLSIHILTRCMTSVPPKSSPRLQIIKSTTQAQAVISQLVTSTSGIFSLSGSKYTLVLADDDHNAYVFRSDLNRRILSEGRVGELLENPYLTKVTANTRRVTKSLGEAGIDLWGVFDVRAAHNVSEFIQYGQDLKESFPSLQVLCRAYNVSVDLNLVPEVDDESRVLAGEALALIQLYHALKLKIEREYEEVFEDLCEYDLKAGIHESLMREHRLWSIFVSNISDSVHKRQLHDLMSRFKNKSVLYSRPNRTAHLIFNEKGTCQVAYESLKDTALVALGPDVKIKLPNQNLFTLQADPLDSLKGLENYVNDPKVSAQIVEMLIEAERPILLVPLREDLARGFRIFTGCHHLFDVTMSKEMLTDGKLAELFSSDKVVKLVPFYEMSHNLQSNFQRCVGRCPSFEPRLVLDLSKGVKYLQNLQSGRSIFKSKPPVLSKIFEEIGLPAPHFTNWKNHLLLYEYLKGKLPAEIRDIWERDCQINVDLHLQINVPFNRGEKTNLKRSVETNRVHVECQKGPQARLKPVLIKLFKERNIEIGEISVFDRVAFVRFPFHPDLAEFVKDFDTEIFDGLLLKVKRMDRHFEKCVLPKANVQELKRRLRGSEPAFDLAGLTDLLKDLDFKSECDDNRAKVVINNLFEP